MDDDDDESNIWQMPKFLSAPQYLASQVAHHTENMQVQVGMVLTQFAPQFSGMSVGA